MLVIDFPCGSFLVLPEQIVPQSCQYLQLQQDCLPLLPSLNSSLILFIHLPVTRTIALTVTFDCIFALSEDNEIEEVTDTMHAFRQAE